MLKRIVRFEITGFNGNVSYLTIDPLKDKQRNYVNYTTDTEINLALVNLADTNAAALRFALEEATTAQQCYRLLVAQAKYAKTIQELIYAY